MSTTVTDIEDIPSPSEATGRDAQLIAACRDFLIANAEIQTIVASDVDGEDILPPLHDRWYAAMERLTEIRARTGKGSRFKALAAYEALKSTANEIGDGLQREEAAALSALADIVIVGWRP